MQKYIDDFNTLYYLLESGDVLSFDDAESELYYILTFDKFYTETCINYDGVKFGDTILPLVLVSNKKKHEEIVDLQKRILDGFRYDINILLKVINEDNYKEICNLANFMLERLKVNMWATEGKKKNLVIDENSLDKSKQKKYPEDNSLFVEVFFVEKLKEVANIDVLALRK